jgi:general secretion pathway protein N
MARLDALFAPASLMKPGHASSSTPRAWRWALGGLLLGLAGAVVYGAPARWLAQAVAQLSQERVLLQQPRGTVWSGSAQLVLSAGPGSQQAMALPERLNWSLHTQGWPVPALELTLALPCCTPTPLRLQAQAGWSGIRLQVLDHHSDWPASALAGLGMPWNTVQFQGRLQLDTRQLVMHWAERRWQVQGQADLSLMDLSSRLSTLRPMGSYRLQLQGSTAQAPMQVQLETLEGRLQLQGQGQWTGERWRFEGEASAAPEHEAALSNLLNVLGQRRGNKAIMTMG